MNYQVIRTEEDNGVGVAAEDAKYGFVFNRRCHRDWWGHRADSICCSAVACSVVAKA